MAMLRPVKSAKIFNLENFRLYGMSKMQGKRERITCTCKPYSISYTDFDIPTSFDFTYTHMYSYNVQNVT